VEKAVAQSKETELAASTNDITRAALREVLQQVKTEEGPKSPEEKETYFMTQVNVGEQLALQGVHCFLVFIDKMLIIDRREGPKFYLPSATAFFRALRVYPAPVELIVIYEKTIIEPVFKARFSLMPISMIAS